MKKAKGQGTERKNKMRKERNKRILASLLNTWHKPESFWKREPQLRKRPTGLDSSLACGTLSIGVEGPRLLEVVSPVSRWLWGVKETK